MRRLLSRLVIAAAVVAVVGGNVLAQALAAQAPEAVFKAGVEAVSVFVSVRDSRGKVVQNLKASDFEVIDSGFGKKIEDFYVGESPISLAILLDISGSMAVGGNMDRARQAVAIATMNLRQADEAALFTFDSSLRQVVDFTTDLNQIRRVSLKGTPWGKTSLYDAIGQTAQQVSGRSNKHRALLVITDGVDTGSAMTAPEVSAIASSIDVPVYLLTVVNPLDHPGGEYAVLRSDSRTAETATLADLARWTGGDMRISSMPAESAVAVQDLFNELRHQYLITFEPGARPGWHPIEIRTKKKGLIVHARSGYMVGPPQT